MLLWPIGAHRYSFYARRAFQSSRPTTNCDWIGHKGHRETRSIDGVTPDRRPEVLVASLMENGFGIIDCDPSLFIDAIDAAKEFYSLSLINRGECLATRKTGVLGYQPSETCASNLQTIINFPPRRLPPSRQRGYCSFDFLMDFSSTPNCPLFIENAWPAIGKTKSKATTAAKEISGYTNALCKEVLKYLSRKMEVTSSDTSIFDASINLTRLLHYPATQRVSNTYKEHTDYEFLTFIFSDKDGLEIKDKSGRWVSVGEHQQQIIVLPGDLMQVLTKGRIRSTIHRVSQTRTERLSFVHFVGATPSFLLQLGPEFPRTFGDHLFSMLLLGAPHLQECRTEMERSMGISVPERNPFRK